MSSRFAALLCLIGAAACSHDKNPPASADTADQSMASSEPAMTPASLETNRPTTSDSTLNNTPSTSTTSSSATTPSTPSTPSSSAGSSGTRSGTGASDTRAATAPDNTPRAVQPDNTKVNERDRSAAAPTPGDQRENESDLKITQHVRQAVMADGSLSFTAKNVKIITQNGTVTLRGPVKTAEERAAIEAAARKVAGVARVDNQIEVKK